MNFVYSIECTIEKQNDYIEFILIALFAIKDPDKIVTRSNLPWDKYV